MHEKVLIIDFGSQFTQLIARKIRELNVYSEIHPFNHLPEIDENIKGVIFSGGPASVLEDGAPDIDIEAFTSRFPVLGICYGAQLLAKNGGGTVERSKIREYGRAHIASKKENVILNGVSQDSQIWMSHSDTIVALPDEFEVVGSTHEVEVAAFQSITRKVWGIQFHPEVHHSTEGKTVLDNFLNACGFSKDWTPAHFVTETIDSLKAEIGNDKVIMGLSGGVDSSVAATLIQKAIGKNLICIFVDNGLLRKDEYEEVLHSYRDMGLNIIGVDAKRRFLDELAGISDPETKRKTIGRVFIDVFQEEANKVEGAKWLGQGTIYPDVIESVNVKGPSATIKSHHNVGGLPEKMHLKVIEPLKLLFKDEVRRVGAELEIDPNILNRHPFPGPGLAIRILGDITDEKVALLQEADKIYIDNLKQSGWYDKTWQAGAILLPVQSVGVMGDERTYERVVALRAVTSVDGMTADWMHFPYELLAKISNEIINKVKGINRVVYDISSKPPATIEWE
ncbi:MAG: glutamine-hydrolyzing GMP synthase [Bacteroidetes bacterium]|nr:glutamine-hydrolyzing GMP synthase [Bacteroidota bacterium]